MIRKIELLLTAMMFMAIGMYTALVFQEPVTIEKPIFVDVPGPEVISTCLVKDVEIPESAKTSTKTYMDYRAITHTDSAQYQIIHSDIISVDNRGFLVTEDGFIGAALGTHFGPVGSKYIFNLDDGTQLKIIKIEVKSDLHTCDHNIKDGSGAVIEFVIDSKTPWMNANRGGNGLIFNGNFNAYYRGKIVSVLEVVE